MDCPRGPLERIVRCQHRKALLLSAATHANCAECSWRTVVWLNDHLRFHIEVLARLRRGISLLACGDSWPIADANDTAATWMVVHFGPRVTLRWGEAVACGPPRRRLYRAPTKDEFQRSAINKLMNEVPSARRARETTNFEKATAPSACKERALGRRLGSGYRRSHCQ
jgi:hypothetical protein